MINIDTLFDFDKWLSEQPVTVGTEEAIMTVEHLIFVLKQWPELIQPQGLEDAFDA